MRAPARHIGNTARGVGVHSFAGCLATRFRYRASCATFPLLAGERIPCGSERHIEFPFPVYRFPIPRH